jgi:hypothetical protein
MKISDADFEETKKLAPLFAKIDTIDAGYVEATSKEISQYQPFLLSLLLGYRLDVTMPEVEEIMKIYFLLWEYFKDQKNIKYYPITKRQFMQAEERNIAFLRYLEGEPSPAATTEVTGLDLENVRSKTLYAGILYRFKHRVVLAEMEERNKGIVLIGVKSLLDCFENIPVD